MNGSSVEGKEPHADLTRRAVYDPFRSFVSAESCRQSAPQSSSQPRGAPRPGKLRVVIHRLTASVALSAKLVVYG
jgi:hypothetical protein